jgi:hypothetical protein
VKFSLYALLAFCLAITAACVAGCFWAVRVDDWGSFAVLSVCAAGAGYMAGVVVAWLRDDASVARERSDTGRRDRSNVTDPGNASHPPEKDRE